MRLLDRTFRKPEENLAFDEVLLDGAESGRTGETLRFWESTTPFVVLGVSQALRQETYERNCIEDRVPILRRCSAGGAVLQGPGCLNFSLVLSRKAHAEIETVRGSYCYILERICEVLQQRGMRVHHKGTSDLALGGKKVSGNAQKRRRKCILHHGTLLHHVAFDLLERYLREPQERPQYRGPRTHRGFLRALPMTPTELRETICEAFEMDGVPERPLRSEIDATKQMAKETYASLDWIRRR